MDEFCDSKEHVYLSFMIDTQSLSLQTIDAALPTMTQSKEIMSDIPNNVTIYLSNTLWYNIIFKTAVKTQERRMMSMGGLCVMQWGNYMGVLGEELWRNVSSWNLQCIC